MDTEVLDQVFSNLENATPKFSKLCGGVELPNDLAQTPMIAPVTLRIPKAHTVEYNSNLRKSSALRLLIIIAGISLGCVFLVVSLFDSNPQSQSDKTAIKGDLKPNVKPIQQIQLGERVLGRNPNRNEVDKRLPDPDPETWRKIELNVRESHLGVMRIELLRPLAWVKKYNAKRGRSIWLSLPEIGIQGNAKIVNLGPCPVIAPPPGQVVTGRFIHKSNGNLLKIKLAGQLEEIGVTSNHPFWSEDRKAYVLAGKLTLGEKVNIVSGTTIVESISPSAKDELVYNLEIHAEHVYRVGLLGALVHNNCIPQIALGRNGVLVPKLSQTGNVLWREDVQSWASNLGYFTHNHWHTRGLSTVSGATTNPQQFARAFNQATQNALRIHFRLDGIDDVLAYANLGRSGFGNAPFTAVELHLIRSNPNLLSKTVFYRNGMIVANPFGGRTHLPLAPP